MTIHHDKFVYGKLASDMEELSEEKLNEMLKQLSEDTAAEEQENSDCGNTKQENSQGSAYMRSVKN